MRASDIIELLEAKHAKDVFAAEVKDGPTWNGTPLRLDGWAMRRSWVNPCMTGYEVKVARSDWLNDKKWTGYVKLVNEFYLVAPDGVIRDDEVPDGIGYLRVSKTGSRLLTVRKAKWREAETDAALMLMQYVLQSRATIDAPRPPRTVEEWKQWLALKQEHKHIGHNVSKALREQYEREVDQVRRENHKAESDRAFVESVIAATEQLGVRWEAGWRLPRNVEEMAAAIAPAVQGHGLSAQEHRQLRSIIPILEKLTGQQHGARCTATGT